MGGQLVSLRRPRGAPLILSRSPQVFPVMRTWGQRDAISQEELNQQVRDSVNFCLSPPRCMLTFGSSVGTSPGANLIPCPLQRLVDTDNMWDSTVPTRITFNTPGLYKLWANISWNYNSTAHMVISGFGWNGAGVWAIERRLVADTRSGSNNSNIATHQNLTGHFLFSQGDYVELYIQSTIALTVQPGQYNSTITARFEAHA